MKKKEYGFLKALGEELIIDENKKSKFNFGWFWAIIYPIILFVITSIGEGLIQDLANDDIKNWACENFGKFCPEIKEK